MNKDNTQDNEQKSQLLYETFFCPNPDNDFVDPNYTYKPSICKFRPITDQQIQRTITKLTLHKAPGPNRISNIVFIKCANLLIHFLGHIFCTTFHLGIYPEEWKKSSTIVLCKPS
ncbi:hypothetical protein CY34DRAFT_90295 [Suillus luteus UH-Slu-Lm8-n1]|uniref:Uncharacterized protein n=1 Tax=Suillus luteus UH-Slu-Lm8-n1 TaxID=930992 RepID=A0A0D0B4P4_9AGAM|nr:hypothetical protein CY34DRAFT_90295 [Suillus luteus UH-Slu-Lm8-n1]